jgi:hypothetical protein
VTDEFALLSRYQTCPDCQGNIIAAIGATAPGWQATFALPNVTCVDNSGGPSTITCSYVLHLLNGSTSEGNFSDYMPGGLTLYNATVPTTDFTCRCVDPTGNPSPITLFLRVWVCSGAYYWDSTTNRDFCEVGDRILSCSLYRNRRHRPVRRACAPCGVAAARFATTGSLTRAASCSRPCCRLPFPRRACSTAHLGGPEGATLSAGQPEDEGRARVLVSRPHQRRWRLQGCHPPPPPPNASLPLAARPTTRATSAHAHSLRAAAEATSSAFGTALRARVGS